jgi:hypothetical protein
MTILNHYEKASEILHSVIHNWPLTPTVYAIVTQIYVKSRKEYITQCNTITNYVTHCVCQIKKSRKTADKNTPIGLIPSGIYADSRTNILHNIFFQPVKSLMKVKKHLYPNN